MEPVAVPVDVAGDFERFYRSSYPGAVRLAWLLTHDASLCEDVAQDAFARVHERFAGLERPEAYLRVAIVNGCRERHRRRERGTRRLRLVHPRPDEPREDPVSGELTDVLRRLPDRQRAAIVLRYWADLPEAETLSWSTATSLTTPWCGRFCPPARRTCSSWMVTVARGGNGRSTAWSCSPVQEDRPCRC